jgi:hypothetical protein
MRQKETSKISHNYLGSWILPGLGYAKINADAALSKNMEKAAIAVVARSSYGVQWRTQKRIRGGHTSGKKLCPPKRGKMFAK